MPPRPSASRSSIGPVVSLALERVRWIGPWRVASAGAIACALAIGGWWALQTSPPRSTAGPVATAAVPAANAPPFTLVATERDPVPIGSEHIVVHVTGAVAHPGVVEVPSGSRVADAVAAAGGPVPGAAPDAVNLAAVVVDGQRVRMPWEGETAIDPMPDPALDRPPDVAAGAEPPGLVDVNRDPVDRLTSLPGIGPVIAAAIVADRERNGAFVSVDDLLRVRGIGPAKLEAIRSSVRT